MRRKLFTASLFMITGILISMISWKLAIVGVLPVFLFAKEIVKLGLKMDETWVTKFFILCYILGLLSMAVANKTYCNYEILGCIKEPKEITARVLNCERFHKGSRFICEIEKVNNKKINMIYKQRLLLTVYDKKTYKYNVVRNDDKSLQLYRNLEIEKKNNDFIGRQIIFRGNLEKPQTSSNPRCFDYSEYLKSKGIIYIGKTQKVLNVDTDYKSVLSDFVFGIKRKILSIRLEYINSLILNKNKDYENISLIRGILFGDTLMMDEEIYEDFQNNGTAHVLAVSGLHMGIIYSLYKIINKKFRLKIITLIFLILLFVYGTMTLWSVSVVRATSLIIISMLGDRLERRYDLLSALGLTAIIVLLINPYTILNVGFQMSFLAVISISYLTPVILLFGENNFSEKGNEFLNDISPLLSVQLGMIPFIAYSFNYLPLMSIVSNILVVFVISIIVPVGIFSFFTFCLLGNSLFFGTILKATVQLMMEINHILSKEGYFAINVVSPPKWTLIFMYLVIFFSISETGYILRKRKKYEKYILILIVIIITTLLFYIVGRTDFDKSTFTVVDVGQGDCIHVRTKKGLNFLIDGGGKSDYNIGKKILKPYLLKNGVGKLDMALATHLHMDHYKGLKELNEVYKIKKIVIKGKRGQVYNLGCGNKIRILWPKKIDEKSPDENVNSLIFKLEIDGISMLITGDISKEGERMLLNEYKGSNILQCDILKVPHHGSKYSSSDELISAVSPKVAVIGVGRNNYGHPSPEIIEKYHGKGIMVYRTDLHGAIGIFEENNCIKVCTNKLYSVENK